MHRGHKYQVKMQKQKIPGHPVGMSPGVLLECPRTSFRDVLEVNVTERVWHLQYPTLIAALTKYLISLYEIDIHIV